MNKLGKSIRLIVLDLDNTLWGGVVGEDASPRYQTRRNLFWKLFHFFLIK